MRKKPEETVRSPERWILDMVQLIGNVLDGAEYFQHPEGSVETWRERLKVLARQGGSLDFSRSSDLLELGGLRKYFLHAAVFTESTTTRVSRLTLAWHVFCALPDSIRPSLKVLRIYLAEAIITDAKAPATLLQRLLAAIFPKLLAPRRAQYVAPERG